MTYTNLTNEELVSIIQSGEEAAYEQLFRNLRPVILHETAMYIDRMETYSLEDLVQECHITCWEVISRGNWSEDKGCFSTYYGGAIRNKLIRIFRDYNLKNLVCIGEQEDYYGNITCILVESDYAKEYRRKKAEQQKRWYEKKKAEQALINPPKPKKPPMTKEERNRKVMDYQKEYYAAHPDKLAKRREKNRIRERERRAARKATMMAAEATA